METAPPTAPPDSHSGELKTLVTGATGTLSLKDRNGKEHQLPPLDIADFVEYEDRMKASVLDAGKMAFRLTDLVFLLFLSLRKEGKSIEDVMRRNFTYTEMQVYRMFDLKLLAQSQQLFVDLLKISGLEVGPQPAPKS